MSHRNKIELISKLEKGNYIMIQFNGLADNAEKIYKKLTGVPVPQDEGQMIISNLKEVHNKIARSESIFNELTDNDLIDYATYDILAEKARYAYLIKQAKKRNLHFYRVTSSAYSKSPPTGIPCAILDTVIPEGLINLAMYIAVASPSIFGLVARIISFTSFS